MRSISLNVSSDKQTNKQTNKQTATNIRPVYENNLSTGADPGFVKSEAYTNSGVLFNNNIIYLQQLGCHPVAVGYFTCKQNKKLVTTRFKSGGLHEKHVVATWNVGNHLSIFL